MRFLLLGGSGQVGTEFRELAPMQDVYVVAPPRDELDLIDGQSIARAVAESPWDAIINAAGYTNVDGAESERAVAFAINGEAPTRLAAETGRRGIPLIHISTDYVFDGCKGKPYLESDPVAPLNVYGRSKVAGEHGVQLGNARHVILRTAWVYSPFGKNFVKTILRLAAERDRLTIVADQRGCPTAARDFAGACLDVAVRCVRDPKRAPYGLYHLAGAGDASWFTFAKTIVELAGHRIGRSPELIPIQTADYPTPARRPPDTRLDCSAIARAFGVELRPWQQALADTIDSLLSNKVTT
jgi:dTDP-4-dehydrorhamnose reductase